MFFEPEDSNSSVASEPSEIIRICFLLESIDDALEVFYLQSSTTNKAAVNVRISEELLCIRRLAATTIENRGVVSYFLTKLLGNYRADVSMDLLSLLCGSGLAGTDSPNGFVSEHNLREVLGRESEE